MFLAGRQIQLTVLDNHVLLTILTYMFLLLFIMYFFFQTMWEERWGNINPYNLVTTEQYLEDMHHILNDKQLRKKVHNFLPYLFKVSICFLFDLFAYWIFLCLMMS